MKTLKLNNAVSSASTKTTKLKVELIKNTTSNNEKLYGAKCYHAVIKVGELKKLNTERNLRDYIGGDGLDKKRTSVHRRMEETLLDMPERWIQRNSGLTITCIECKVLDDHVILTEDSLINGCQSKGELQRWLEGVEEDELLNLDTEVRVEIIVEPSDLEQKNIAIARNTSNQVKFVSQANALGYLNDLKKVIDDHQSGWSLQKNETDYEATIPAQKLLQIVRLFIPEDLLKSSGAKAYASGASCLTDFCKWHKGESDQDKKLYKFTLEMATTAWSEYQHWDNHPCWKGKHLQESYKTSGKRPAKKLKDGNWTNFSTGIIMPMLYALKWFVVKDEKNGNYSLKKPDLFNEEDHINEAIKQFQESKYNPLFMGRNASSYTALEAFPKALAKAKEAYSK